MAISAWNRFASLDSPDGKFNATIDDATELGMGAPTSGELVLSTGITIPNCGASIVWADNSEFLAVPQWQSGRRQRVLVVSMLHVTWQLIGTQYSVIELSSFEQGMIRGVDSPAYNPTPIQLDTTSLTWS